MGVLTELSSPNKKLQVHLLYCLLGIQFIYIIVDHLAYHHKVDDPLLACLCNCPASPMVKGARGVAIAQRRTKLCSHKEEFFDDDDNDEDSDESSSHGMKAIKENHISHPNPWQQMKWIGQPSSCLVKGRLIEKLDEKKNFRRGYALKFVEDVEDKTHLLPWLLASKVNLNKRKRRVYIDLGANRFTTSVRWFLRMYPCDFTEIHAFEANLRSWRAPKQAFDEGGNALTKAGNDSVLVREKPGIPKWMLERIHIYYKLASHKDDERLGSVNITRFIKEELKLTREDAVVVKMDIEGSEWPLLKAWMEDPQMPNIVDELFIEAHYAHPSMRAFGWDSFSPITRQDAKHLLGELRWKGFYTHAWP
ncbi:hypothetical protein GOP47_0026010 [Adiantum capillus-veneris]|uniref:Methyltransferase FkbM domain-containing protein n=1 Tax=Adiantum capillus-veneris TaxID=13818 RepID=A0A9D4U148_ADICA|nr:hypothetical protein GOP47_0026010 [Adiantum capillus-veneris]